MSTNEIKTIEQKAAKSLMVQGFRKELLKIMTTPLCNKAKVKDFVESLGEDTVCSLLTRLKSSLSI